MKANGHSDVTNRLPTKDFSVANRCRERVVIIRLNDSLNYYGLTSASYSA